MNQRELLIKRRKVWYSFHIPGTTNLHRIKKNAVFLSAANSWEHEQRKCWICYKLKADGKEFITEAERNRDKSEARKGRYRLFGHRDGIRDRD